MILNRAVVLAIGTAFAAVGYILLVVVVGSMLDTRTGGFWLSLLGTAAVAIAFQPLRRSVVRAANRLAYGPRAQPYEELSQFNRRLAETPTPATLLPAVAQAAARAVSARGATVTMAVSGIEPLTAHWGEDDGRDRAWRSCRSTTAVPPSAASRCRVPRGGELRPSDVRLLEALADQAAVAFRNAALETQLAGHVAELDRTTRQIADSRARIVAADDAVRRTLEEAISRDVVPHLVRVAGELDRAREDTAALPAGRRRVPGHERQHGSGGTAGPHPGGVPHAARTLRDRAGPEVVAGPRPPGGHRARRPLRRGAQVPGAGGGGRVLLLRGGVAGGR